MKCHTCTGENIGEREVLKFNDLTLKKQQRSLNFELEILDIEKDKDLRFKSHTKTFIESLIKT